MSTLLTFQPLKHRRHAGKSCYIVMMIIVEYSFSTIVFKLGSAANQRSVIPSLFNRTLRLTTPVAYLAMLARFEGIGLRRARSKFCRFFHVDFSPHVMVKVIKMIGMTSISVIQNNIACWVTGIINIYI